jgi:hypothetical protein
MLGAGFLQTSDTVMQGFEITRGRLSAKHGYRRGSTAAQLTSRCSRFGRSRACKRSGGGAATGVGKWSRWALPRHTWTFARGMAHRRAGSFSAGVGRLARSGAPGPFSDRGRREGGNGPALGDWVLEWREGGMGSVGKNSGVSAYNKSLNSGRGPQQSGFDAAKAGPREQNVGRKPKNRSVSEVTRTGVLALPNCTRPPHLLLFPVWEVDDDTTSQSQSQSSLRKRGADQHGIRRLQ